MPSRPADPLDVERELRDLKQQIAALRERLEASQVDQETAVTRAVSAGAAETTMLRSTIGALQIGRAHV